MAILNTPTLPEHYQEAFQIDLNSKKEKYLVNGGALAIMIVMVLVAMLFVPLREAFDMSQGFGMYCLRFGVMFVGIIAYMFLHELVHGICMLCFSDVEPKYGFSGLYAYAGSTAYFNKSSYRIIALAPVVLWGIVLLALSLLVSPAWFWIVYVIQLTNISGAAGDFYVTWKMSKLPEDALIHDTGVEMKVFLPKDAAAQPEATADAPEAESDAAVEAEPALEAAASDTDTTPEA